MSKFLQGLKLQLFADGGGEPTPQPTPTPQPQAQPIQQQPQVDINELVSNISNRINDTLNQRLSPIEQRMNQPTAEQLEAQNEQIRQQFESNPLEFVKSIQQQAKEQALNEFKTQYDPMIKQTQMLNSKLTWQDQIRQFTSSNPEAAKSMPQITETLRNNPELLGTKDPLGNAYKLAIANNLMGNGDVVQGVLGNEEYRQQIMQNPELKQAIINEYQQGLNSGQQGLPPIMGNTQGGSIPASGGELPKNLKEARMAAMRRFQQQQ
jgi:hypothetical protein